MAITPALDAGGMNAGGLRRVAILLLVGAVGAIGAIASLPFISATSGTVGPGRVELRAATARSGGTRLSLPPLGAISAATHEAPVALRALVQRIDLDQLQRVLSAPDPQRRLEAAVERDMRPLLREMVVKTLLLAAVVGGLAAAVLPGRRLRHLPAGALGGLATVAVLLTATWRGYDTAAFAEPRFEGSLERAPAVLRAVGRHVNDLAAVRKRVSTLGRELSSLYESVAAPSAAAPGETRLLHVSDIHLNPLGLEIARQLAERFDVGAIVDTGDLTSFGYPLEARISTLLVDMPVPYVLVPGNHDSVEVRSALAGVGNVTVLDGTADVAGVRILGVPDPTFTADNEVDANEAAMLKRRQAAEVTRLVDAEKPDVLAVHDPLLATRASGHVALVVAGHVHRRGNTVTKGTRVLTVGSSGATGLGSFTVDGGRAYEAEVLSFTAGRLTAIDYVSLRGIGGSFRVDRVVIPTTSASPPPPPNAVNTAPLVTAPGG